MKLERYEASHDSGIEWLGEVPECWEYLRMKYLFKDISIKNKPNSELLSVTQNKGVIPRASVENRMVMPNGNLESFKFIQEGDFAISLRSFEGGLEYCYHDGIISPAYTVLKTKINLHRFYYKYLFKSYSFISELQTSVVGIREGKNISYPELSYSFLPFPPFHQQTKITDFLDQKTAQIDKAISLKEKLIEKLKEYRQILINDAVTKGLDKNVKMKDSWVEWIGEVPEGWYIEKFRYLFNFSKGLNITKENLQEKGIPCVNYGEIHSKYGFEVDPQKHPLKCVKEEYLDTSQKSLLKRGDFIFADTSEDIEGSGNFTYLNSDIVTFAGYHTVIVKAKKSFNYRYIAYFFDSNAFRNQVRNRVKGVKVYSITNSILKDMLVCLPSDDEQQNIANHLDKQTQKINKAINQQQKQIEKIKEYKASLIDSVVTGKVRVL